MDIERLGYGLILMVIGFVNLFKKLEMVRITLSIWGISHFPVLKTKDDGTQELAESAVLFLNITGGILFLLGLAIFLSGIF